MIRMMLTGALIIFFTGFVHVWSVFLPYVTELTGWSPEVASLGFYLSCCSFVIGNILGGKLSQKIAPKKIVSLGGSIFCLSILLASFSLVSSPVWFCLTYGIAQGVGDGMVYGVILSTAQKWFPSRTGFASGIIVTSNGLCAFFLAPLCKWLLGKYPPGHVLFLVGILIGICAFLSSVCYCSPDESASKDTILSQSTFPVRQYTSGEMLHSSRYYLMVLAMFSGLIPYYLISPISQTYLLEKGISDKYVVSAIMAGALLNAGTRLILPSLSDYLGKIRCVLAILILSMVSMLLLALGRSWFLVGAVGLSYMCFGGIMGSFPSLTSSVFGLEHFTENYGYVMIGMIVSSLSAPLIRSFLAALGLNVSQTFFVGAGFAMFSFLCLMLLDHSKEASVHSSH